MPVSASRRDGDIALGVALTAVLVLVVVAMDAPSSSGHTHGSGRAPPFRPRRARQMHDEGTISSHPPVAYLGVRTTTHHTQNTHVILQREKRATVMRTCSRGAGAVWASVCGVRSRVDHIPMAALALDAPPGVGCH